MTGASATILQGDALAVLAGLPDASVHCVVTSPPYYGLRDYGVDGQIGLEDTPAEYVDRLVAVFREVRRVLRADGVCWLNIGDSYANDTKWGGNTGGKHAIGLHGKTNVGRGRKQTGAKPKDLLGIPWRLAFALQDDGWWLRQDVIWHKPNPMPESVTDRCTKAHEYVFLLTKSARYFYDAQAVAEPSTYPDDDRKSRSAADQKRMPTAEIAGVRPGSATYPTRNRRSVWTIATEPSSIDHFAKMPDTLAELCILAGTSARGVCPVCGAPWVRVIEKTDQPDASANGSRFDQGKTGARDGGDRTQAGDRFVSEFTGWSPGCTCAVSCDEAAQLLADHGVRADLPDLAPVPATVLDPFSGTGTTVRVAVNLGRNGIGIELKPAYVDTSVALLGQTQPALFGL